MRHHCLRPSFLTSHKESKWFFTAVTTFIKALKMAVFAQPAEDEVYLGRKGIALDSVLLHGRSVFYCPFLCLGCCSYKKRMYQVALFITFSMEWHSANASAKLKSQVSHSTHKKSFIHLHAMLIIIYHKRKLSHIIRTMGLAKAAEATPVIDKSWRKN